MQNYKENLEFTRIFSDFLTKKGHQLMSFLQLNDFSLNQ